MVFGAKYFAREIMISSILLHKSLLSPPLYGWNERSSVIGSRSESTNPRLGHRRKEYCRLDHKFSRFAPGILKISNIGHLSHEFARFPLIYASSLDYLGFKVDFTCVCFNGFNCCFFFLRSNEVKG